MGETNSELERIFNSYRYQVKNTLASVLAIYIVFKQFKKCVLMKATCEGGF